MEKTIDLPCDGGTLRIYLNANRAELVRDYEIMIRCTHMAEDRSRAGIEQRIKNNVMARADRGLIKTSWAFIPAPTPDQHGSTVGSATPGERR